MRIEIDEQGFLLLERGKEMKEQYCPYCQGIIDACGDWCPLFREPDFLIQREIMEIGLCECYLHCKPEEFIDRRGK